MYFLKKKQTVLRSIPLPRMRIGHDSGGGATSVAVLCMCRPSRAVHRDIATHDTTCLSGRSTAEDLRQHGRPELLTPWARSRCGVAPEVVWFRVREEGTYAM